MGPIVKELLLLRMDVILDSGYWVLNTRFSICDAGLRNLDSPKKAILFKSTIWSEKEINGYTVEAIPTAVFLLMEAGECTLT